MNHLLPLLRIPNRAAPSATCARQPRVGLSILVSVIGLLLASPSFAQAPPSDGAADETACAPTTGKAVEDLVEQGKSYARDESWVCARAFLKAAYSKRESYDIAGNLGITTHELAKQRNDPSLFVEAATYLGAALRGFPVSGVDSQRALLEERERECRMQVVALELVVSPPGACVTINDRDNGCGPFPYDLFAAPGTVVVGVTAPGHQSRELRIENTRAGSRLTRNLDLATQSTIPVEPVEPTEPRETPTTPSNLADRPAEAGFPLWPTFVVGGLALAAIGVGAGMWVAGDGEQSAATELRTTTAQRGNPNFCAPPIQSGLQDECDVLVERLDRSDMFHNLAIGLFVGGGVMAVGTSILLSAHLLSDDDAAPAMGVQWVPVFDPRGSAGVVARGWW